jgi:Putative Ig domain
VKVTDSSTAGAKSATQALSILINLPPPPSITTTTLPAGVQNTAYSQTVSATAGLKPYTFTISSGSLPTGLTLSSAGVISGTPTVLGTFSFTVKVTDSSNPAQSATQALSIKINPAPVVITTTSLPNGVVNAAYSATLQATGGAPPLTWSVTVGSLPTGLVLNGATGAITGTPTTAGTSSFTVQAADSSTPPLTATKVLAITVNPVLSITTSSLPNGITSTAYSATLQSTGGVAPVTWSVTLGTLPAGLSLSASTGAITGTPTTAGTSSFTVQAADSGTPQQKVTKVLSITIVQQLAITTSSLPTGAVNSLYSATLQSTGGTPAVTWSISVGALPAGLTLNASTGAITGTPTTAGTTSFTVQATDSGTPQQIVTKSLGIVINPVLVITTTSPMPSGTVGTAYSQTLQTNGGGIPPISWSITIGALPTGLSLNSTTGAITGTPTASGTFNFTVQAADSGTPQQTASAALSISIATAPLSVATTSLPNGVVGQSYSATLQSAGGTPPVTWSISVGSLPAGLSLNASTGAITGSPTTAGATTFTVKATDSTVPTPQTATKQLSIQVNTVLTITTTSLPNGTVDSSYSATLQSSGGATPITWSISAGSLPSGLSLNSSTGAITGTPTAGGTSSFTVKATDSTSPTPQVVTQSLSITVNVATLVITTTSLPDGALSTSYNQTLQFSGGTPPITWVITVGSLPAGLTLASNGNITGTPTTAGTSSFTVKATDSTTPTPQTATASLSITVNTATTACGTGSEGLLKGQYAALLQGFDSSGPVGVGLMFDADGLGGVAKGGVGIEDINSTSASGVQQNLSIDSTKSKYSVGSDHRGCLTVVTGTTNQTFRFSLGSVTSGIASNGHIIEFDSTTNSPVEFTAGVLRKQDTTAFTNGSFSGNYAFGVSGPEVGGGKFAVVGVLSLNGAGSISSGTFDTNDNGSLDGGAVTTNFSSTIFFSLSTGSSYTIGSNGRGTSTLDIDTSGTQVHGILYVVSASELLTMSSDSQTGVNANALFVGKILKQTKSSFGPGDLTGTYVTYSSGLAKSVAGGTRTSLGLVTPTSTSAFNITINQNDGGTLTSGSSTGTYSVASNGRGLLAISGVNHNSVIYLVSPSEVFSLDASGQVGTGLAEKQSGSPFSAASAKSPPSYAFGTIQPEVSSVDLSSGVANFDGVSAITGTSDDNSSGSGLHAGGSINSNYTIDSTGTGNVIKPPATSCSFTGGTCDLIFIVISPTKAVLMDANPVSGTSNTTPSLTIGDQ